MQNFCDSYCRTVKAQTFKQVQSSKFRSVMADSACDVGVSEVDVYACHLVRGKIENSFVRLKACEKSKASGIKAAV